MGSSFVTVQGGKSIDLVGPTLLQENLFIDARMWVHKPPIEAPGNLQ